MTMELRVGRHHRFIVFLNNEMLETIVEAHSCGDTALQREAVFAVGGNEWQAADATRRFETLFCGNKV